MVTMTTKPRRREKQPTGEKHQHQTAQGSRPKSPWRAVPGSVGACRRPAKNSTRAMVPIESAKPTMWKHSRVGKTSSEEFKGFVISTWIHVHCLARSSVYQRFAKNPPQPDHLAVTDR